VRYVDSLNLKDNIECFILIEPGLGYIIPVLQEKFLTSKIITLHIEDFPLPENCIQSKIKKLVSIDTIEIQKFLETHLIDINIENIHIIEWRPSINYYKEQYVKLLSQVVGFIKRTDAGNRTTAAFGKRWVRNFFKNLNNLEQLLLYRETPLPVIITGSGPSLEEVMPIIKNVQDSHIIIAASSSLIALQANGITADIVIATDGGNWALHHLYSCKTSLPLAVNLCAALPSQCVSFPKLLINDGSYWQSVIFHKLALPSVIIPQRGTVTATALELALQLNSSNIYLTGMDFSFNDIKTHVKPYTFDNLFFGKANRTKPVYSELFLRFLSLKDGGSMNIYSTWFKEQLSLWQKRIFSIGEHSIFETSIPQKQLLQKKQNEFLKVSNIENNSLKLEGANVLINTIKDDNYAANIKQELIELLFPNQKNITNNELETAILEVCND